MYLVENIHRSRCNQIDQKSKGRLQGKQLLNLW